MTKHDINTDTRARDPLAERVLSRIESERIAPRPRWTFSAKNIAFWALGALAVLLGALAVAAGLFELAVVDWRLSSVTHPNFVSFFFSAAPVLWGVALALFIGFGYVNIRRTRHGYRYPLPLIMIGAVLTSLTLGSVLYLAGFGGRIEAALGDHPPFYRPILVAERAWWSAPQRGLLLGEVTAVGPDLDSFTLRDASGKSWDVNAADLRNRDLAAIARGGTLRVVGLPAEEGGLPAGEAGQSASSTPAPPASTPPEFHACFIFPWNARGTRHGGDPLPMPFAALSSTSTRRTPEASESPCRSILPYRELRGFDEAESEGD